MYFSAADRGEMMSMVYNWPAEQVSMSKPLLNLWKITNLEMQETFYYCNGFNWIAFTSLYLRIWNFMFFPRCIGFLTHSICFEC